MPLTAEFIDEVLGGRRRGGWATALRWALALAEPPVWAYVTWKNWRHDHGWARRFAVPAPVVSVGNITAGGVGKTPLVEWLTRWFAARGARVGLVSRGYGARDGAPNDEALELARKLPETPHVQDRDRVAAVRRVLREHGCQVVLVDDGFQHRRLRRDCDVVLLDALAPFGHGHLLPRGLLREPLRGLARAHAIGLTRANLVSPSEREAIRAAAARWAPRAIWLELAHRPRELVGAQNTSAPLADIAHRRAIAFCGIGNPRGFQRTAEGCVAELRDFRAFADHCPFDDRALRELEAWARRAAVDVVLCTEKDLVKINQSELGGKPLWAVRVGMDIPLGLGEFETLLDPLLRRALQPTV